MRNRVLFYGLVCFFATSPAWAQVGGALSGTVTDQFHAVVSGATVTVKNTGTGAVRGTIHR